VPFAGSAEYLAQLEARGELLRVRAEIDPYLEITEMADRLVKRGGPALLIERPAGAAFPLVIGLFGTPARTEFALGAPLETLAERVRAWVHSEPPTTLVDKLKQLPRLAQLAGYLPKIVSSAPCQQVTMDPPDLGKLPVMTCWPGDGGPFFTLPMVFTRDPDTGRQQFARVKVPQKILPRFVPIPTELSGVVPTPGYTAVPLEQLVAFNLRWLFPGMTIEGHYFFRITRDADLELRDLEADDLMEALQEGLRKRRVGGEVVRVEVADEMPEEVVHLLMEGTDVEPADVYRTNGPLGLDDLMSLMAIPLSQLRDAPHTGRTAPALVRAQRSQLEDGSIKQEEFESIFSVLRRGDVLLHHPFDLFSSSVEEFLS